MGEYIPRGQLRNAIFHQDNCENAHWLNLVFALRNISIAHWSGLTSRMRYPYPSWWFCWSSLQWHLVPKWLYGAVFHFLFCHWFIWGTDSNEISFYLSFWSQLASTCPIGLIVSSLYKASNVCKYSKLNYRLGRIPLPRPPHVFFPACNAGPSWCSVCGGHWVAQRVRRRVDGDGGQDEQDCCVGLVGRGERSWRCGRVTRCGCYGRGTVRGQQDRRGWRSGSLYGIPAQWVQRRWRVLQAQHRTQTRQTRPGQTRHSTQSGCSQDVQTNGQDSIRIRAEKNICSMLMIAAHALSHAKGKRADGLQL